MKKKTGWVWMLGIAIGCTVAAVMAFMDRQYEGDLFWTTPLIGAVVFAFLAYSMRKKAKAEEEAFADAAPVPAPNPAPVQNMVAAAPPSVNIKVNRKTFTKVWFPVAGVTFRNNDGTSRQKILREICNGDDFGTALGSLEEYDFEGEQAIRVVTADGCVGNIRKSDLKEASKFLDHMVHHIDVEVETFENDDGKVIYRADVVLNLDPDDPEQRWFFDDLSKS